MNAREAAELYIARGWQVVPLAPGSKAATDEGWLKLIFKPGDFNPGDNIGIRSVGGLVVVDEDCVEAVALADQFIPATGAVWERKSKPRSKRLFKTHGIDKTIVYKDEDDKTIVEIRANHQDMAPPSIHPDGEELKWNGQIGDPSEVTADELKLSAKLLSTASLIARRYAAPGARHEWCLALAGLLKKLGITEEKAQLIISSAGKYAGEQKPRDREVEIKSTYAKQEDEPATGGKTLAQLGSKKFVSAIKKIWGEADVEIPKGKVAEINKFHAVIDMPGQVAVLKEYYEDGELRHSFQTVTDMRILYPWKVVVQRGRAPIPLGQAWVESPQRRFYSGIELAPHDVKPTEGYYNIWRGFAVEPKKGNWDLFRKHIEEVMACRNKKDSEWLLGWMAKTVKYPSTPIEYAPAFRGGQGVGKGCFADNFGGLFGRHFVSFDSHQQLTAKHNPLMEGAIVVHADEALWAGGKAGIGAIRRMITEKKILIEPKNINIYAIKNFVHLIVSSNEDWIVPVGLDERRFVVFDVSNKHQREKAWFTPIWKQMANGGLAAMLYDLLEWPDIDLSDTPQTEALEDQKLKSMDAKQTWWHEILSDGDLWREGPIKEGNYAGIYSVSRDWLFDSYVERLKSIDKYASGGTRIALGVFLKKVLPEGFPKMIRPDSGNGGMRFWGFPDLTDCRKSYEVLHRNVQWEDEKDVSVSKKGLF